MKTPLNPLVSILLPTRKRPELLFDCIRSIVASASGNHEYEIIVRMHRDDQKTLAVIPSLLSMHLVNIKIVVGYPHSGYADLSRFYDDAAAVANGKFIWVMNDDVKVSGAPWDMRLLEAPTDALIMPETHKLGLSTYHRDFDNPFMLMPNRCWEKYEIRKFDSPFDNALWTILRKNGWPTYFLPGVVVHHDREHDDTLLPKRREDEEHMENL